MSARDELLTKMHVAVENELIERRDACISVMGPANGMIVRAYDGSPSPIMRMGTREAMGVALDVVLAAGYVKPRVITTLEKLDALANTSVIRDKFSDVYEKRDGNWCGYESAAMPSKYMASKWAPFTVLWEPTS